VLTTAPTDRQVRDLLWKEVRVQRGKQRGGFRGPKMPRLESTADHFAHGFTAKDGDSFQGNHSAHTLIIFDEAVGVAPEFWETAESMFVGEGHAWLAIFNLTDTSSQAYTEELSGGWHVISLSLLEHPNIAAELAGLPPPFPFIGLSGAQRAIESEGYPNRRSELWFSVAERALRGDLSLIKLDPDTRRELRRQAMAPIWKLDNEGRRVVEPKDQTKKRIKRSPDGMDALNLAYAPVPIVMLDEAQTGGYDTY
jgi:hypothetical protein